MSCEIHIHVVPGARKSEVTGFHGEAIKVKIHARAVDGKANEALIDFLSEKLKTKPRNIVITQGLKSREKKLSVEGMNREEALRKLT